MFPLMVQAISTRIPVTVLNILHCIRLESGLSTMNMKGECNMSDLEMDKTYQKGSKGQKVKLIQEWLNLHGFHLAIDGDFGSATEYAVKEFQKVHGLVVDGVAGPDTFVQLIMPMTNALKPIIPGNRSLGEMVVAYARQHLQERPREAGGQNMGPWVRLYMGGNQGVNWPWCAGFVSFILKQACQSLQKPLPIKTSVSCDSLAASAKENGIFLPENKLTVKSQLKPGAIFLNRRTSTNWIHTGIVIGVENEIFHTIEGNTNDEGSAEGYEVCQRVRGYKSRDFILI